MALIGLAVAGAHGAGPAPGDTAAIDAVFADYDKPGSPGCMLGVVKDGVPLTERSPLGILAGAFVWSTAPIDIASARYLVSAAYAVIALVVVAAANLQWTRAIAGTALSVIVFSGITSIASHDIGNDPYTPTRQMANALAALGVAPGQRVATLAWNGYRHLELYYAVSGSEGVLHTINPRLHPDQVVWIADHAEDQVLFFDLTFLPLVESIASRVKTIRHFVAMTDRAHMPASTTIPDLRCYEELVAAQPAEFAWPELDERSAATLCSTPACRRNTCSAAASSGEPSALTKATVRAPLARKYCVGETRSGLWPDCENASETRPLLSILLW